MFHTLMQNPVITGGLTLLAAGSATAYLRHAPAWAWEKLEERLVYTVEVESIDPSFPWLKLWLSERSKARYVTAGVAAEPGYGVPDAGPNAAPRFYLCPRGTSVIRHRGRRVLVWPSKQVVQGAANGLRERIVLKAARVDGDFFRSIFEEAHAMANRRDGSVEVWAPDSHHWRMIDRKPARPRDSLVLADGVWERTVDDAAAFLGRRAWYAEHGVPFRRSYLFYGPPGSGKSSLAHAMASALGRSINAVSLGSIRSDEQLMSLMVNAPASHVLLLEDADATGIARVGGEGASFSALLNVLDGASAREGRIVIMTTNHLDRLDPALVRAGRADVKVLMDDATADQAARMFRRFLPEATPREADAFGVAWAGRSVADIQEHLIVRTGTGRIGRCASVPSRRRTPAFSGNHARNVTLSPATL